MNELVPIKQQPMPVAVSGDTLSVAQVFEAVRTGDMTQEKIAVLKDLLAMSAERQFAAAFAALQADLPVIVAQTVIPNRGKYERFEDVMNVVQPLLNKHGFSVAFSMDFKEGRVLETCCLTHVGGHSRSNSFAVRVGGRADSETQADCKAATTAKRNALCNALNIVIRQDCLTDEDDPRMEGGKITQEQAEELRSMIAATKSNEAALLKLGGCAAFEEMRTAKYEVVYELLQQKIAKQARAA